MALAPNRIIQFDSSIFFFKYHLFIHSTLFLGGEVEFHYVVQAALNSLCMSRLCSNSWFSYLCLLNMATNTLIVIITHFLIVYCCRRWRSGRAQTFMVAHLCLTRISHQQHKWRESVPSYHLTQVSRKHRWSKKEHPCWEVLLCLVSGLSSRFLTGIRLQLCMGEQCLCLHWAHRPPCEANVWTLLILGLIWNFSWRLWNTFFEVPL